MGFNLADLSVILKLTEITYTKIKYVIRKFLKIRRLSFLNRQKKKKTIAQKYWKIHDKSVERSVVQLCFISKILRVIKRRTRQDRFYNIRGEIKAV